MAIAFYPLWGILAGLVGAVMGLEVSWLTAVSGVLSLWLIVGALESRVLSLPLTTHLVADMVVSVFWFVELQKPSPLPVALLAQVLSRAALVVLAYVSRPSLNAPGWIGRMNGWTVAAALLAAVGLALFMPVLTVLLMIGLAAVIIRLVRTWAEQKGGLSATHLSLAQRSVELAVVLVALT